MADHRRLNTKRHRAVAEAETRLRITESAVELHGTLGPAKTSVGAVARHAGVRRSTVYRHFPNEKALFAACSAHWAAANPLPDSARWATVANPWERLREALGELYGFYRHSAGMLENVLRDEPLVPVLTPLLDGYRTFLASAEKALMRGWSDRERRGSHAPAALGHALAFSTWRSLVCEEHLEDHAAVDLMVGLIRLARGWRPRSASTAPPGGDSGAH